MLQKTNNLSANSSLFDNEPLQPSTPTKKDKVRRAAARVVLAGVAAGGYAGAAIATAPKDATPQPQEVNMGQLTNIQITPQSQSHDSSGRTDIIIDPVPPEQQLVVVPPEQLPKPENTQH